MLVLDEVEGAGELACEQIWQLENGASDRFGLASSGKASARDSWFSPAYGAKLPGRSVVVEQSGRAAVRIVTAISVGGEKSVTSLEEAATLIGRVSEG